MHLLMMIQFFRENIKLLLTYILRLILDIDKIESQILLEQMLHMWGFLLPDSISK